MTNGISTEDVVIKRVIIQSKKHIKRGKTLTNANSAASGTGRKHLEDDDTKTVDNRVQSVVEAEKMKKV